MWEWLSDNLVVVSLVVFVFLPVAGCIVYLVRRDRRRDKIGMSREERQARLDMTLDRVWIARAGLTGVLFTVAGIAGVFVGDRPLYAIPVLLLGVGFLAAAYWVNRSVEATKASLPKRDGE